MFHETDRGNCRTTSTCVFHLTVREGFCRGVSSGLERQTELRRKREENLDTVLAMLLQLVLPGLRGFGGICRNHVTASMLWGVVEVCKGRERAVSYEARGLEDVPLISMTPIYDTDLLNSSPLGPLVRPPPPP